MYLSKRKAMHPPSGTDPVPKGFTCESLYTMILAALVGQDQV